MVEYKYIYNCIFIKSQIYRCNKIVFDKFFKQLRTIWK